MKLRTILLGGIAALSSSPVYAQTTATNTASVVDQTTPAESTEETAETAESGRQSEVIVTGTRIVRPNMTSNAPVTVVDEQFLRDRGLARVEDALSQIPQITPMLGLQGNGWSAGRASVNLRRLGAGRTLTLLNGQRADNDVNIVPGALIERIDILTGGASAVYGSDAIAGVVNFIIKRRFEGLTIDAEASGQQHRNDNNIMLRAAREGGYPLPQRNYFGGGNFFASLAAGKTLLNDRVNITAFAAYREAKPMRLSQIDTTICPLRMNPLNPTVFRNDTYACDGTEFNPYGYFRINDVDYANARDGSRLWRPYDETDVTRVPRDDFIQRADRSVNAGGFLTADLVSDITFNGQFLWSGSRQKAQVAETAAFYTGDVRINCDNPFLSPQQAGLLCGAAAGTQTLANPSTVVLWRKNYIRDLSPRFWNWRASGIISGTLVDKVRFEVSYLKTRDIYRNAETNVYPYDFDQFARGLQVRNVGGVPTCLSKIDGTDPSCVPVDAFSSRQPGDEVWNWLTRRGSSWQQNDMAVMMGVLSGTLDDYGIKSPFATNGVGFSLVLEQRDVRSQSRGAEAWSNWTTFDGKARVRELAGEIDIPLVEDRRFFKELSINGGYRVSNYTTYEKLVHTWKAEATWAPFDGLRFRGSYNRAVRVPVLERLEGENRYPNTFAIDLCAPPRRPTEAGQTAIQRYTFEQCSIGMTRAQYDALTNYTACNEAGQCPAVLLNGGNPNLQPERGQSYTAGMVIQPSKIPGLNGSVDVYDITIDGAFEWARWGQAFDQCYNNKIEFWCGMYQRDPQSGQLTQIDARYTNSGETRTQGIDFSLNYLLDPQRLGIAQNAGKFSLAFNGSLVRKLTRQFAPNTPTWSCVGYHGFACGEPSPKWRHVTSVYWSLPDIQGGFGFTWRYIGSTRVSKLSSDTVLKAQPRPNNPDTYPLVERLPGFSYLDFASNVDVNKFLTLRFNVQNLLDKDPPLVGFDEFYAIGQFQNTYSANYTVRGRTIRLGLTARF